MYTYCMENYTLQNEADLEKESVKQKIKSILDFPLFNIRWRNNKDPRHLKEIELTGTKPGDISKNSFAQLILVILGEQFVYDAQYSFDSEDKKKEFIDLVENTGIQIEIEKEEIINEKLNVNFTFATSKENIQRIKNARELITTDRKAYDIEYGKLMGFPQTAIDEYVENKISNKKPISQNDMTDERFKTKGLFAPFKFSEKYIDEERALLVKRNELLKEYAPSLFR